MSKQLCDRQRRDCSSSIENIIFYPVLHIITYVQYLLHIHFLIVLYAFVNPYNRPEKNINPTVTPTHVVHHKQ